MPQVTPTLYLVTPDGWPTARLIEACDAALAAGARWVQYRNKSTDGALRHAQAAALADLTRRHAGVLLINDDVELALRVGAQGVHLGEHDGSVADARDRLGATAIIGASCYNALGLAQQAAADGASYLAFGAFFVSTTKPLARRAGLDLLGAAASLQRPLCAIGGITAGNVAPLVAAGADLIAVVSAVFDAADPAQATQLLLERMGAGFELRNATRQMAH